MRRLAAAGHNVAQTQYVNGVSMILDSRILAAAIAALCLLTACSDGTESAPPTTSASAAPAAPAGEAAPAPAPTPEQTIAAPAAAVEPAAAPAPAATAAAVPAQEEAATAPATQSADGAPAYDVSCPEGAAQAEKCQVGRETYIGWRSYHTHCFQCHGGSGMGSTFAPNLMDRFNSTVDYARFKHVLQNGYTGKVGAMPSFAKNSAVLKDTDALYGYLRARADGVLPAGRPVKKP